MYELIKSVNQLVNWNKEKEIRIGTEIEIVIRSK